jgi:CheY-like chemotaxis protein
VDDDADARYILRRVLEYCGALVSPCSSVEQALHTVRIAWPNVLVTDLDLPDGDGYTLVRTVRALETDGRRRLPAVIVTAQPIDDHREQALAAGFSDVLAKPVDFDALCRLVRRLAATP